MLTRSRLLLGGSLTLLAACGTPTSEFQDGGTNRPPATNGSTNSGQDATATSPATGGEINAPVNPATGDQASSSDSTSASNTGAGDGQTGAPGGTTSETPIYPDDPLSNPATTTPTEVAAACDTRPQVTVRQDIKFADPGATCSWGVNGNLSALNGLIRARIEQVQPLAIPQNAIVCGLSFSSATQAMRFDDEIFINFNETIVAASMDYSKRFDSVDGLYKYDWLKLRDAPYEHSLTPAYCAPGSSCSIPATETSGQMTIKIDSATAHKLSAAAIRANRYDLGWVTVGDNDASDCRHTDFGIGVDLTYVLR